MARDLYDVLGVPRDADTAEIKQAFRELTKRYHPDRNRDDPSAEVRFREIRDAYEVLGNPEKRAQYDRFGEAALGEGFGAGPRGYGTFEDIFEGFGGFGDLFGEMFGGRRTHGARAARRGEDLRYDLTITLAEAAAGVEREITFHRHDACETCDGTGCAPNTSPEVCPQCRGTGQMRISQGWFTLSRPCNRCGGTGQIIRVPCATCHGSGRVRVKRTRTIPVPAGADTGLKLRVAGEGERGEHGGPPGDLYIFLTVAPHPIFVRDGDDLLCEEPIGFPTAALGGEIEVPTLDGTQRVHVPAGTQSGEIVTLRGRGMPSLRGGGRGDQRVRLKVETPNRLTPRQRELLHEFAQLSGEQTHPEQKSFFDKVKEVLGV